MIYNNISCQIYYCLLKLKELLKYKTIISCFTKLKSEKCHSNHLFILLIDFLKCKKLINYFKS